MSKVSIKKSFNGITSVVYADGKKIDFDSYRDEITIRINNLTVITIPMADFVRVSRVYKMAYDATTLEDYRQWDEDDKRLTPEKTPLETMGYRAAKESLVKGHVEVHAQGTPEYFKERE